MLNGKFFTGLPPKMIDRSGNHNRMQTNFFWPDDSQSQSVVESRVKRGSSIQAQSRDAYTPQKDSSHADAGVKERFKKEFTKSSIQFYDNLEPTPSLRRNRQQLTEPPTRKPQNMVLPDEAGSNNKRKEAFTSKIQFCDNTEDLNNVPKTDKNNKVDVERNTKNSPKLQNKQMVLQPTDEAISFIENNVRNVQISVPPRRRNTVKDNRPRYMNSRAPLVEDQHFSDYNEDYRPPPPRRLGIQPTRGRYHESDPDFDPYSTPRKMPLPTHRRPGFYDDEPQDYIDAHYPTPPPTFRGRSAPRHLDHGDEAIYSRKAQRQVHFDKHDSMEATTSQHDRQPQIHIVKVENELQNNEAASSTSAAGGGPSHKHLVSNICLSDSDSHATPSSPPKRNIRSSAVNRVSVGLPD